jgi:hypothetical protein
MSRLPSRLPSYITAKTVLERSVDELAAIFESSPYTDVLAGILEGFNAKLAADILNSNNLSASKAYNILASSRLTADKTQSILYNMPLSSKLMDILTANAGDLTVSANTSISGVNRYRTLTVNSGVTLTITEQPGGLIIKTLNNGGTIAKSATGGAGGAPGASGAGAGGAGGGGLVIFADSLINGGTISADGVAGAAGTTVAASAAGGAGGSGVFFRVGADAAGLGGDGGNYSGGGVNPGGVNGAGGGGYYTTRPGGAGDGSSYTNFADYASLATRITQSVIDWVIVNVFAKSPTSTQAIPNVYGSGGGGGGAADTYCAGGGGGGGGGEVLALCVSLNNTGTIRANAGNGGNGGTEGSLDACGGGGGGGIVYALYKTLVNAGTLTAAGGVHGPTADYHGTNGTAGTANAQAV